MRVDAVYSRHDAELAASASRVRELVARLHDSESELLGVNEFLEKLEHLSVRFNLKLCSLHTFMSAADVVSHAKSRMQSDVCMRVLSKCAHHLQPWNSCCRSRRKGDCVMYAAGDINGGGQSARPHGSTCQARAELHF